MESSYSLRSPAVKRLMREAQELKESTEQFFAQPLDDNLFEWHFTIRGPADSEFENGIYHGRIILPPEYPMKPPSIMLLTPNGRFETNKKICLSISGHHPESWQPSWSLRTALLAIIGFMPTHGNGAIGSLDYTADERKVLARKSLEWKCPNCGPVQKLVLPVTEASKALNKEAKELGSQINLQGEKEKSATASSASSTETSSQPSTTEEHAAGAAGPVPRSDATPAFPAFPYPVDPRLMFPLISSQHPNGAGNYFSNASTPAVPHPVMPPFFFPGMMYNPLMQQRPLAPFPPYGYYPPGFPMPGTWMGPGTYPPSGAVPGASRIIPNLPGRAVSENTDSLANSGVSVATATGGSVDSRQNNAGSIAKESSMQNQSLNVSASSATSPPSSGSNIVESASSSSSQPSSLSANATPNADHSPADASDPLPAAGELRQRNLASERGRTPPVVQRTSQLAEIPQQNSLSSSVGRMLLNIIVAVLVLCVVALLSRRVYLLGKP